MSNSTMLPSRLPTKRMLDAGEYESAVPPRFGMEHDDVKDDAGGSRVSQMHTERPLMHVPQVATNDDEFRKQASFTCLVWHRRILQGYESSLQCHMAALRLLFSTPINFVPSGEN